jgi:hypothetical protein
MSILRLTTAFPLAVATTFVGTSVVHTEFVLAGLASIGAAAPIDVNLATVIEDVGGLAPTLAPVIGIALALGFVVAAGLKHVLKPLAAVAYPIAGFAAMATALYAMKLSYHTTPLAGARSEAGFVLICAAGTLGGWVFAALAQKKTSH